MSPAKAGHYMSALDQRFERRERAGPAEADDLVVATPARALLESRLRDMNACGAAGLHLQLDLERHRADRFTVWRQPERVGDEEPFARLKLHDGASEDAAEAA